MFPFSDYLYPVLSLGIIVLIIDFITKKSANKTELFSLITIVLVSGVASYYTSCISMLFPVMLYAFVLLFNKKQQTSIVGNYYFSIVYLLAACMVYLFLFNYAYQNPASMVICNKDQFFYINEALQMSHHGVESVVAHSGSDAPTQYHYFDLWILKPLSWISHQPTIIYLMLFIPLLYTLVYSNIIDIIAVVKSSQLTKSDYIITFFIPLITPFPFVISDFFSEISPSWTSVFGYAKTLVILWFVAMIIREFITKNNPYKMFILCVIASLSFITIAPSLVVFCLVYYINALYDKRIKLFSKANCLLCLSMVVTVLYLYFIYHVKDASTTNIAQISNLSLAYKTKFFLLGIAFLFVFIIYLPSLVHHKISLVFKTLGRYKLLYFIPLGGLMLSTIMSDKIPNANQFYALSISVFATIFIPMLIYHHPPKKITKSYFFVLFLAVIYFHRDRFIIELIDKNDYLASNTFTRKNKISQNIGFIMPENWRPSSLNNLEDFFAPNDILINTKLPQYTYWLELYQNGLDVNDRFYEFSLGLLKNTPFQLETDKKPNNNLYQNQELFVKKKNIKTLIVANPKALSPLIKSKIIDSANIKHKNIPLYKDLKFTLYQLR